MPPEIPSPQSAAADPSTGPSCPHCGQPISAPKRETAPPPSDTELDHRGIRLPRRTRMGGIITPQ